MMDEAKYFRAVSRPNMRLTLVPSLWGSGAERSPITVLTRDGRKHIEVGIRFLPDEVVYWPALLSGLSADRARHACGDVWAHALEALVSPLADASTQSELARLVRHLLHLPLAVDERWFQAGGDACELQSRAGVGLVHGIAHHVEGPLRQRLGESWGHARLCAILLLPVADFNFQASDKWLRTFAAHQLETAEVMSVLRELHEPASYRDVLIAMREHWNDILRDPCTRTNSTLVRARSIEFFESWKPS
jgi:alcohol dehydrogenase class IV